ncbi:MAG: SpoIIE family protein phosphatase [Verrucomicrobiae bacterium]|nr:SpoIIE family protein phosphatase [Verrucomicrobiae bacterium]
MVHFIYIGTIVLLIGFVYWQQVRGRKDRQRDQEERDAIVSEEQRMFEFLHGLGESLQEDSSPPNMHRYIVNGVSEVVDADGGILYLLENRDHPELVPVFQTEHAAPVIPLPADLFELKGLRQKRRLRSFLQLTSVPRNATLLGAAMDAGSMIYVDELLAHSAFGGVRNSLQERVSAMLAPLVYGQKEVGVLAVIRNEARGFSKNDRDVFASIAEQSSFALGSAIIHAEASDKRRLEDELKRASEIQRILLPKSPPGLSDFNLASIFRPARMVSGDYFDYVAVDDDHFGVAIGDVCGKGIAASLIMAMCRSTLRNNAHGNPSPSAVLHAVNRAIFPDIREDMFVSLLYVVLGRNSGDIELARAGHEPPLLFRRTDSNVETVEPPGMAAGIDDGEVFERSLSNYALHLDTGDVLLLYTDGVTEAADPEENEFGIQRLREVLAESASGGAQAVVEAVSEALTRFTGTAPQSDDITLIAVEKR